MAVIKSTQAPTTLQAFSMQDIENQAKSILLRARQQADQLLAAAQTEGEALRKEARAAGAAEGHAEGLARGREAGTVVGREQALGEHRAQLTSILTTLTRAATELNATRRDLEAAALKDVLGLAIAIAERVTKRQGVLDATVAVANAAEAMKLVMHASDVRIAIHPAQKAVLEEALPKLKMQWPTLEHVELVADEALAPGGCRIFTAQGIIDGDLDEQIARVVADLLPERQGAIA